MRRLTVAITVTAIAAMGFSPALAEKVREEYVCNAIALSGPGGPGGGIINVVITRWSTDEEEDTLLAAVGTEKRDQSLYNALTKQKKAGFIQFQGQIGYPLRYASEAIVDGRRQVVAATERPVYLEEYVDGLGTIDHTIGLVILDLDPETGEGTGVLSVGTSIIRDPASNDLKIESFSVDPIRLTKVTLKK